MERSQTGTGEDDEEWEYEYSATETETYYLTLDLSVRDFLERRTDDIFHNTRSGYRVWYNPLFNAPEPKASNSDLLEDKDADDEEPPEREDADLDTIGMPAAQAPPEPPIDPLLQPSIGKNSQQESRQSLKPAEEIQILGLHSDEPIVSYRNHVFIGTWSENIGTEMIFALHDDDAPLPALRRLHQNIDLLAASASRINFHEATLRPRDRNTIPDGVRFRGPDLQDEDIPERYKRNGGIYVHIGGDKTGQRQPQAHFLEDLIALKRKRGETDQVTIQPLETRQNKLMIEDEEEERRRRKARQDHARNMRWRDRRREEKDSGFDLERNYVPRKGSGRRGFPRLRTRRAALISRDTGVISRYSHSTSLRTPSTSTPTPVSWNDLGAAERDQRQDPVAGTSVLDR
ncbi:hypothetical protein VTK26DRAFT_7160 [Humicola hyalothermophila]